MGNMKILVVDDEKYEAALMEKCVDWPAHGFEVVGCALSAQAALKLFAAKEPDIVFCDINMPLMDGLEMSRRMKAQRDTVRIVIVTGYPEFEYARQAIDIGVESYILKPIETENLLKAAEKARDELLKGTEVTPAIPPAQNQLTRDTIAYIEDHLPEQGLSLKDIAPAMFVSSSHLSRVFRADTGESLTEYIFRRRMEKSKELFNTTSLRAGEVAMLVGFGDTHYFGQCFKKFTGRTVNEYKAERNEKYNETES